MSRTHLLLASALVLLAATGVVAADVVGKPLLDATLQTDSVSPGEDATLSLTILNNGSVEQGSVTNPALTSRVTTARGLRIRVDPDADDDVDEDVPLSVRTGTFAIGSLPEGGAAPIQVPVSVHDDAEPGAYKLPINVSYRHTSVIEDDGTEESENVTRILHVPLRVEGAPRFAVQDVSTGLRVASTETVAVTVENTGGATAHETILTLESPNPDLGFGASPSSTRFVGEWPAGETRTVEFEVSATEGATPQEYPLHLTAAYEDEDGVPGQSETRRLSVRPRPEGTFEIGNVSSTLAVGEEGRLVGTLENTGSDPVRNVVVVFTDRPATVTPLETESPVGDLDPGESAEFTFPIEVGADANAGDRQFSVQARYRTAEGDLRQSDAMDVAASVGPESPAFAVETTQATVRPGESGTLSISVTNEGEETYRAISAKLFADSDKLSSSDDEAFVSALEPGESANVTFAISASSTALAKDYPVSLDFRYDDADGDTLTSDTYRLAVSVAEDESGGGLPIGLIVLSLAIVVGGVYFYRTRG